MTTIAWDGKTLAVDRAAWQGRMCMTTKKLHIFERPAHGFPPGAWADCGNAAFNAAVRDWLDDKVPLPYPADGKEADEDMGLWVTMEGKVFTFHKRLVLSPVLGQIAGSGGGALFVLGAMAFGATAQQAVAAAEYHTDCSAHGVDTWSPPCFR